jgi:hypothetical protein
LPLDQINRRKGPGSGNRRNKKREKITNGSLFRGGGGSKSFSVKSPDTNVYDPVKRQRKRERERERE